MCEYNWRTTDTAGRSAGNHLVSALVSLASVAGPSLVPDANYIRKEIGGRISERLLGKRDRVHDHTRGGLSVCASSARKETCTLFERRCDTGSYIARKRRPTPKRTAVK